VVALLALGTLLASGSGCGWTGKRELRLVLLVTVDTLRADHLGAYGGPGLTPNLDRLAGQSVVYEHAYTPTPFTLSAMTSAMTSRYSEELGVLRNRSVLPAGPPTLAGWLAARHWRTGAVVSNSVLSAESGIGRGFERYDTQMVQSAGQVMPERRADATTAAALAMLDQLRAGSSPVFLWVHYQDPHGPYLPPDPPGRAKFLEAALATPEANRELPLSPDDSGQGGLPSYQRQGDHRDPAYYRAGYMGEIAYTDAMIGLLLHGLEERGLSGRTALLFAADHGEGLGEGDYWFAHGEQLLEPLVRVPLFVHVPGLPPGRRTELVSLLDVFPTIAALAGGQAPPTSRGRNLLDARSAGEPTTLYLTNIDRGKTFRRGVIDRGLKYVRERPDGADRARETLVAMGTDGPNLEEDEAGRLERIRATFRAARASIERGRTEQKQRLSPEQEEALKSLGYTSSKE
jgi:arylsulfatase